jgi:VanZ family protein
MEANTGFFLHFLVLLILSVGVFSRRYLSMVVVLFLIPAMGEAVQFFIPGRTPDIMDIHYGYLGILAGYCLVRLWREIKPVVKKVQLHLKKKAA